MVKRQPAREQRRMVPQLVIIPSAVRKKFESGTQDGKQLVSINQVVEAAATLHEVPMELVARNSQAARGNDCFPSKL